jgi:hypothetical protein
MLLPCSTEDDAWIGTHLQPDGCTDGDVGRMWQWSLLGGLHEFCARMHFSAAGSIRLNQLDAVHWNAQERTADVSEGT